MRTFMLDGQFERGREEFEQGRSLVTDDSHQPGGVYPTAMYSSMGDAMLDAVGATDLAQIYEHLTEGPTVVAGYAGNMDNVRGRIALRLDRLDEAERHLERALEWTEAAGWPVDRGRVHQALASLAERRGEAAEAARQLDEAAALFTQHGAEIFLKQVQASTEA